MGKPAPTGIELSNQLLSGTITAVGPTSTIVLYGAFNILIYNQINTSLTTTHNSSSATVASGTGLAAGQAINGANVPVGTTIGAITGTAVTLAFPPGNTNADVVTGADSAALFYGNAYSASVQVERSFDGGVSWVLGNVGGGGTPAIYNAGTPVSIVASEPERGILYRLNCTAYTSGTINYRFSTTSPAATAWGIPAS